MFSRRRMNVTRRRDPFDGSAQVPHKGWRMAKIDDDDIGRNTSDNETFEQVVEARLSRRGFLGGTIGTVAAASLSSVGALLQAVPASAKTHNRPLLGFSGIPASSQDSVVLAGWLHRRGPDRLGRPGVGWTRLPAERQQQRRRSGPAVGDAQRRRRLLPDQRLGARPAGAEQRVHRRRAAVPGRHRQLERRRRRRSRSPRTACP